MEGGRDPYRVLGVARDATNDEIRRAFQVLAKEKHPDANKGSGAAAEFQAVKEAYDLLKDPGRRKVYDFSSSSTRAGLYTAYSDPAEAERLRQRADEFRRRYQNPGAASFQRRAMAVLEKVLSPRGLVLLPLLALGSWWLTSAVDGSAGGSGGPGGGSGGPGQVPAWWNPEAKRWETPAPWNPAFHAHRDSLRMMPRGDVHVAAPPRPADVEALR